jgi:hypothetical protein
LLPSSAKKIFPLLSYAGLFHLKISQGIKRPDIIMAYSREICHNNAGGILMKVGILGAGSIAKKMTRTLNMMESAEAYYE